MIAQVSKKKKNFICHHLTPKGEVTNSTVFLLWAKWPKTQLESGENSSSQGLSGSPQHFTSQRALLNTCAAMGTEVLLDYFFTQVQIC